MILQQLRIFINIRYKIIIIVALIVIALGFSITAVVINLRNNQSLIVNVTPSKTETTIAPQITLINGTVTDGLLTIADVKVVLTQNDQTVAQTTTDASGKFSIKVSTGNYVLICTKNGFNEYRQLNVSTSAETPVALNIQLTRTANPSPTPTNTPSSTPQPSPTPTPQPSPTPTPIPEKSVTTDGIIAETNLQRRTNGIAELKKNDQLTKAAEAHLADLFQYQYFAHENPTTGEKWSDFILASGYTGRGATGENLAEDGNAKATDQEIVALWMGSPGHKANILKTDYQEIGVAAGWGKLNNYDVWLVVQIFGAP